MRVANFKLLKKKRNALRAWPEPTATGGFRPTGPSLLIISREQPVKRIVQMTSKIPYRMKMHDELSKADDEAFPCRAQCGYQTDIVREVESLVSALPLGAASLPVSRVPHQPDWPEPL
jgi:hypothetical protein